MKIFMTILILFLLSCAPKYTFNKQQAGLHEHVTLDPGCTLEKIDTIYNPMGGVVKILHIKCQVK
jgi:hypothetical protein